MHETKVVHVLDSLQNLFEDFYCFELRKRIAINKIE